MHLLCEGLDGGDVHHLECEINKGIVVDKSYIDSFDTYLVFPLPGLHTILLNEPQNC